MKKAARIPRFSVTALVVLAAVGVSSPASAGVRLVCSGWVIEAEGTPSTKGWKVKSIKPPFTGETKLVATITPGSINAGFGGNSWVHGVFPPGIVDISWIDSDGRSRWTQQFRFTSDRLQSDVGYFATWSKDGGPQKSESGNCESRKY